MKTYLTYIFSISLASGFLLSAFSVKAQQLKLGNNPTQIEKSAVLELESENQGLLLTRVPDTNVINTLSPPDGMIIYFTDSVSETEPYGPNAGVYQRKDGGWLRISQFFKFINDTLSQAIPVGFETSNDTVYLYIPDVHVDKGITRGLINGGEQEFGGEKRFNDSLIAESVLRANKVVVPMKNTDTLAFLTTDADGLVRLDTLDHVFWLLGGNNLINPARDSTLGTINAKDLSIITNNETRILVTSEGKVGIGTETASEVTDTLTVNGSFKLGREGSPFSTMAHAVVPDSSSSPKYSSVTGYDVLTWGIPGIKKNAHVVVNPENSLKNGSSIAMISWVRASDNGVVTICFYTTGTMTIQGPFDVYYINPK